MIKNSGIVSSLSWVVDLLSFPEKARRKTKKIVLDGLLNFKKGQYSKEGAELVEYLKDQGQFIGFQTNVSYIMENSKNVDELEAIWVHPLSEPSLLFKIKDMPVLITVNPNIEYNNSVLNKIEQNKYNKTLLKVLKNSKGING